MKKNNNRLNSFVLGLCFMLALTGASGFASKKDDEAGQVKKTKSVKQDDSAWRDTLYVLGTWPSVSSNACDVVFTNRHGTRQMVRGMRDNVTTVQDSDVVVIDADCKVVQLLERKCRLDNFLKQK